MSESNSTVEYRIVSGYPAYRVGSDGSLWTLYRWKSRGHNKGQVRVLGEEWVLMPARNISPTRYREVKLVGLGKIKLHFLILEAFVGPRPEGMEGCHKDDNKLNNSADNLRWDSHSGNMIDRVKNGLQNTAVITPEMVILLRRRYAEGTTGMRSLAKEYGLTRDIVRDAVLRRTWRHVP